MRLSNHRVMGRPLRVALLKFRGGFFVMRCGLTVVLCGHLMIGLSIVRTGPALILAVLLIHSELLKWW